MDEYNDWGGFYPVPHTNIQLRSCEKGVEDNRWMQRLGGRTPQPLLRQELPSCTKINAGTNN